MSATLARDEDLLALQERDFLTAARQRSGPEAWQDAGQAGARRGFVEALILLPRRSTEFGEERRAPIPQPVTRFQLTAMLPVDAPR